MPPLPFATPPTVAARLETLATPDASVWLVGEGLAALLRGDLPRDLHAATTASRSEIVAALPDAVPLPTEPWSALTRTADARSLQIFCLDASGIEGFLADCDFRWRAMACDPLRHALVDPYDGRADLRDGVVRAVGDAAASLAREPLRALRAARLCAQHAAEVDAELERAMVEVAAGAGALRGPAVRDELCRLLCAPNAGRGVALLRRTGIEGALFPGAREDAAALIDGMPVSLVPRLVAWLRGTRAAAPLRQLRFGVERSETVHRLLDLHPLDQRVRAKRDASIAKLLRHTTEDERALLFRLREQEARESASDGDRVAEGLAAVRNGIERVEVQRARERARSALAIDGAAVMQALACGPGREVGRALRHLSSRVEEDPSLNEPDTLLRLLETWSRDA